MLHSEWRHLQDGNNNNVVCDWSANGYRLPTEAEWEKASRGRMAGTRFPWTDYTNNISHEKANYYGHFYQYPADYDLSDGYHPTYATGGIPYTSPVGSFAPNGYGLYDIVGNVWEVVLGLGRLGLLQHFAGHRSAGSYKRCTSNNAWRCME